VPDRQEVTAAHLLGLRLISLAGQLLDTKSIYTERIQSMSIRCTHSNSP